MIIHYLVIWIISGNMNTRRETPMDLELDTIDQETAEWRYKAIKETISNGYNIDPKLINIVNICRL